MVLRKLAWLRPAVDNLVVDSTSIEVNRLLWYAKSDRLDARKLLRILSVVRTPTLEEEDRRQLHRGITDDHAERVVSQHRARSRLTITALRGSYGSTSMYAVPSSRW